MVTVSKSWMTGRAGDRRDLGAERKGAQILNVGRRTRPIENEAKRVQDDRGCARARP
jgi:hypothetical protein